ncbi:MAG: hypothetical protein LBB55_05515 [Zoogloeaceae bacterium]|jgi:hypothetical protein|nr:hypothetical protein [Zoogloeaceae bacterium]
MAKLHSGKGEYRHGTEKRLECACDFGVEINDFEIKILQMVDSWNKIPRIPVTRY